MANSEHLYPIASDDPPKLLKESALESWFIEQLKDLKYVYREDIRNRKALEDNFRVKFEALNQVNLTDAEFGRLLDDIVTDDVYTASKRLRERNSFTRDDGTPLNYTLVNTKDWCKNDFEVVNQLTMNTDHSRHRYDVMILINGVPIVQVELKALGINPRRAMEQIVEYKNDPGNGYTKTLLCFLQLFVVSNRDRTYYFANNNTRHFTFNADERFLPIYEFADESNKKITHLQSFAESFLQKCTLAKMISRYMVLIASEQKLMMMRPYQIYAVQHIVQCINDNKGNGYIWHTTGSGKTLTSFKASTLLKENDNIHKCVFVVDRKDLDRQTREEFNRFQEGCVEENTNTSTLVRRLLSDDYADKVIVTTIQKLGLALDNSKKAGSGQNGGKSSQPSYASQLATLRDKRMVFIFDECHRSQFGENHRTIKNFFPDAQLFGFTGTPIFEVNASAQKIEENIGSMRTTEDLFHKCLHSYTITHAIEDGNVLRFHVDYFKPDKDVVLAPGQAPGKRAIVEAILDKHDAATSHRRFNALLATSSINDAIAYHNLFAEIQAERQLNDPDFVPLNIACVFSPPADGDPDIKQIQEDLPTELEDNKVDPEGKKAALQNIIKTYNEHYGTNHRISEFDQYYQDVQKRIKDHQWSNSDYAPTNKIDITIVVDMLLTGFDSKYLNTLYVDKSLKHHGLIQAFSRTNRVLNATKPYGNILDFRQQQESVDTAITLFSGEKTTEPPQKIWLAERAPVVIDKLQAAVAKLNEFMSAHGLPTTPDAVANLRGTEARIGFIEHFKEVQRLRTQLEQYTDLTPDEAATIEDILPEAEHRGFRGAYLETSARIKNETTTEPENWRTKYNISQLDFEFVLFASSVIDYDYIMSLLAKYSSRRPGKTTMTREQLISLIHADAKFLDERTDITEYINTLKAGEGLSEQDIREGYTRFKAEKNAQELTRIAERHDIPSETLQHFVDTILSVMIFDGEHLSDLFASKNLGWRDRKDAELALMSDLVPLLKKRAGGREISGLSAYEP